METGGWDNFCCDCLRQLNSGRLRLSDERERYDHTFPCAKSGFLHRITSAEDRACRKGGDTPPGVSADLPAFAFGKHLTLLSDRRVSAITAEALFAAHHKQMLCPMHLPAYGQSISPYSSVKSCVSVTGAVSSRRSAAGAASGTVSISTSSPFMSASNSSASIFSCLIRYCAT